MSSMPRADELDYQTGSDALRILAVTNLYPTSYAPTSGTFIEQQIKGLRKAGLKVEVMLLDRIQTGRSVYLGLERRVLAKLVAFEPHLVHVMYGGIMADKVSRFVNDRPVVVSFCGTDLLGQPLVGHVKKLSAQYNVWASHRAARRAQGIVVKAKNLRDALPEDVDQSKIRIIPNGVDLERFKPMEKVQARHMLGWAADRPVILFVTVRGHPRKRLILAQEAVSRLHGYAQKVDLRIMQGVPHDQVPLWLNASDILILTSVHEGGVNTVKEAMACNLPVVSVDVGDVRERLDGVRLCRIAEPTPDGLSRALSEVLCDGGRSDGRDHLSNLTLMAVAGRLKQFYIEVLSGRGGDLVPNRSRAPLVCS